MFASIQLKPNSPIVSKSCQTVPPPQVHFALCFDNSWTSSAIQSEIKKKTRMTRRKTKQFQAPPAEIYSRLKKQVWSALRVYYWSNNLRRLRNKIIPGCSKKIMRINESWFWSMSKMKIATQPRIRLTKKHRICIANFNRIPYYHSPRLLRLPE